MISDQPPPGSAEAVRAGCTCPWYEIEGADGKMQYVYSAGCPLHGNAIVAALFKAVGVNEKEIEKETT